MTAPKDRRPADIIASLDDDEFFPGADLAAARETMAGEDWTGAERPDVRQNRLIAAAIEHGQRTTHGDHTVAEAK